MPDNKDNILKKEVKKAVDEIKEVTNYEALKGNLHDLDRKIENDSTAEELNSIFRNFRRSINLHLHKKMIIAVVILILICIPGYIMWSRPSMGDIAKYESEKNVDKLCEVVEYATDDPYYKDFSILKSAIGAIARLNTTTGNVYIYKYITGPKIINMAQRDELIEEVVKNNKDYTSFLMKARDRALISNNVSYTNLGYFEFMYIFGVDKESKIKIAETVYERLVLFFAYGNQPFEYFTEFYKLRDFISGIPELAYLNVPINAYLDLTRDYDSNPDKYVINNHVRSVGNLLVNNLKDKTIIDRMNKARDI